MKIDARRQHFRGGMDHWDPAVTDGFASGRPVILFNNAGVASSSGETPNTMLDRVMPRDNLKILTGQPVRDLIGARSAPERITGVVLEDGRHFSAGTVLLAAGAMHSPRLLQRYMETNGLSRRLPNYRLVGRYFKRHLFTAMLAISPSRKTDVLRKTALWVNEKFPHSSVQPLGFDGEVIGSLLPRFVPRWQANAFGQRAYGFFLQTEDGSDENNRVMAEARAARDPAPYPKLDYDPARLPQAVVEHRRMTNAFRRSLLRAGYLSFVKPIPLEGTAHACGTLVTGKDPHASVVDPWGKVHGLENLYVVDGSILPRSSRVNPSLTIYAWALLVASLIASEGSNP